MLENEESRKLTIFGKNSKPIALLFGKNSKPIALLFGENSKPIALLFGQNIVFLDAL